MASVPVLGASPGAAVTGWGGAFRAGASVFDGAGFGAGLGGGGAGRLDLTGLVGATGCGGGVGWLTVGLGDYGAGAGAETRLTAYTGGSMRG